MKIRTTLLAMFASGLALCAADRVCEFGDLTGYVSGNIKMKITGPVCTIDVTPKSHEWACFTCVNAKKTVFKLTPDEWKRAFLRFYVNGGTDTNGRHAGGQRIKAGIHTHINGHEIWQIGGADILPYTQGKTIDNDPKTFQKVEIPFSAFTGTEKLKGTVTAAAFQFLGTGNRSGIVVKDISVFVMDKAKFDAIPKKLDAKTYQFEFKGGKKDHVYRTGDTIELTCRVLKYGEPCSDSFRVVCCSNGLNWGKSEIVKGPEFKITKKAEKTGWHCWQITALDKNSKVVFYAPNRACSTGVGVVIDPEKITAGGKEPADFDAFWKSRRAMLDKVPVEVLESVNLPEQEGMICKDLKIRCAGSMPVSGYLVMPKNAKKKSLPGIIHYHWAGVLSSMKQFHYGKKAIVFDVNAHGIVNGKDRAFYDRLNREKIGGYQLRNKENREKIYFHDMFLRIMRAMDYVKSLPEWDGKTLIVYGTSQGGGQSLAAAALDPQVTYCSVDVPALCDHGAPYAGRRGGWPGFWRMVNGKPDNPEAAAATAYYDDCFFAKRIRCPVVVSTGLYDETCVPTSVIAAFNAIPVKDKSLKIHPRGTHGSSPNVDGRKRIEKIIGL